jgi:hypothetical protein
MVPSGESVPRIDSPGEVHTMPLRSEKDVREEIRKLREKGKSLSGFWVSEIAAATYALEWVLGKRDKDPANDVGEPESGHGKLAESISKAAQKEPPAVRKPKPAARRVARKR